MQINIAKNSIVRFICPAKSLLTFFCLAFWVSAHAQTVINSGELKKCFIVSDIHFNPLYGTLKNDTALKHKLATGSFEDWKKYFESSAAQTNINKTLLFQDANYGVLRSALANMKEKLAHPAFIVIAGDFIWHGATVGDSVLKRKSIRFIARLFKESFPGVTIIPAMGNNDTYGKDYDNPDPEFLKDFADAWSPNLPKSSADELKAQGYYKVESGNMKFIVLNSALLYSGTHYPQATQMLIWLQNNLANAQGKKVWIVMHIPPGINGYNSTNFWNPAYTQTFVNDEVKYANVIKLSIASHTHFNDFKVFYNAANYPVSFMRIVPSICSNHGNNPSFEVADFDHTTGTVIRETNYYLNLAAIPKDKSVTHPVWSNTLSLPASLGINKIDASNFSKFLKEVKQDTTSRQLKYYTYFYSVGTDTSKTVNRPVMLKYLETDSLKAN